MSSNLIENKQIIQMEETENNLIKSNNNEWEKCCNYIASLSVIISIIFLIVYFLKL